MDILQNKPKAFWCQNKECSKVRRHSETYRSRHEGTISKINLNNNTAGIQSNTYSSIVTWITLTRQETEIALLFIIPIKKTSTDLTLEKMNVCTFSKQLYKIKRNKFAFEKFGGYYFNHLNKVLSTEVSNQGTARGDEDEFEIPIYLF